MKFLLLFILILVFTSSMEAGPFRKGPVFPLFRRQVTVEPRNPTPATPNPPPIVSIQPTPIPVPVEEGKVSEEDIKILKELLTVPVDPSKFPPWMPLAGVSGGALVTLLAFLRKSLTSI